jgi:hypothetical protein
VRARAAAAAAAAGAMDNGALERERKVSKNIVQHILFKKHYWKLILMNIGII